jgi:hypothetical protein
MTGFVFAVLASRAKRRADRLARDISQQVDGILDGLAAHEDKRRQWEAELADLEAIRAQYPARPRNGTPVNALTTTPAGPDN